MASREQKWGWDSRAPSSHAFLTNPVTQRWGVRATAQQEKCCWWSPGAVYSFWWYSGCFPSSNLAFLWSEIPKGWPQVFGNQEVQQIISNALARSHRARMRGSAGKRRGSEAPSSKTRWWTVGKQGGTLFLQVLSKKGLWGCTGEQRTIWAACWLGAQWPVSLQAYFSLLLRNRCLERQMRKSVWERLKRVSLSFPRANAHNRRLHCDIAGATETFSGEGNSIWEPRGRAQLQGSGNSRLTGSFQTCSVLFHKPVMLCRGLSLAWQKNSGFVLPIFSTEWPLQSDGLQCLIISGLLVVDIMCWQSPNCAATF